MRQCPICKKVIPNGTFVSGSVTYPITGKSDLLNKAHYGLHYKDLAIEPIQYIEANKLPFHEGSIVKYISRWRVKGGVNDLKKALFYINRLIELEEQGHG